jgi:hypothetical protein
MTQPGATLKELVSRPSPDAAEIGAMLDALGNTDRIAAVRSLGGTALQGALWKAVEGNPRATLDEMVPADYPRQRPAIFHGKNSLPAFTEFQKICFRPADAAAGNVAWGYNETRIRALIGAGYFVLHDTPESPLGGAGFDYTRTPGGTLPSWPEVKPTTHGISRLVYANMIDYMRRVSRDVFIGSALAVRSGREMGSYFILARELLAA